MYGKTIFVFLAALPIPKQQHEQVNQFKNEVQGQHTIVFAWKPANVNHTQLTSYTTKSGEMTYEEWCKTLLPPLIWNQMECWYISDIQAKCISMGWHKGTQQIFKATKAAGNTINIIDRHRQTENWRIHSYFQSLYRGSFQWESKMEQYDDRWLYNENTNTKCTNQTYLFV